MSFVVRHKETGFYLRAHDSWTNQIDGALCFNSGLRLVDYVEHGGVREKPERIEILVLPNNRAQGAPSAGLFA